MQAVAQQPRRSPLEKAKHALEQLTAPSDAQPAAAPLEQGQEEQLLLTSPAPPGTGDQAAACRCCLFGLVTVHHQCKLALHNCLYLQTMGPQGPVQAPAQLSVRHLVRQA